MKLKSILILAMVAIMAMAGGAFAATTTLTNGITFDTPGFAGGTALVFGTGGLACNTVAGQTGIPCAATPNATQNAAFVTDSQTGSGTGLTGGMPPQVSYNPNLYGTGIGGYTSGVGPQSGYQLSQTLYGMCAFTAPGTLTCPKFVPTAAAAGTPSLLGLLISEGGGNALDGGAGTVTSSTIPSNTAAFNEATFITGLVTGFVGGAGAFTNQLSQHTFHHSVVASSTGSSDGDYIDQRLSQFNPVSGTGQTLAQSTQIGGSSNGLAVVVTQNPAALDPTFTGMPDPYVILSNVAPTPATLAALLASSISTANAAAALATNGGQISQAVADDASGGAGSYGQLFQNDDMTVVNNLSAAPVAGPATTYNAASPIFGGTPGGSLP